MFKKIAVSLALLLIVFLGYVASRPSKFEYEKSAFIEASADKIFPYISDFKLGSQWSPYEKMDPHFKKQFSGPDGQVGSKMEFQGNSDVGAGHLEILKVIPNELVEIRLTMLKPMEAENIIRYTLTPEGSGTRFTWRMEGDVGFFGKLITVFVDCEGLMGPQFAEGIANLKSLVESAK